MSGYAWKGKGKHDESSTIFHDFLTAASAKWSVKEEKCTSLLAQSNWPAYTLLHGTNKQTKKKRVRSCPEAGIIIIIISCCCCCCCCHHAAVHHKKANSIQFNCQKTMKQQLCTSPSKLFNLSSTNKEYFGRPAIITTTSVCWLMDWWSSKRHLHWAHNKEKVVVVEIEKASQQNLIVDMAA